MSPRDVLIAACIAGAALFGVSTGGAMAPTAADWTMADQPIPESTVAAPPSRLAGRLPTVAPDRLMTSFAASTPITPPRTALRPGGDAREPVTPVSSSPTPPVVERKDCDPAYPEERTCIPPGPPFDQGCAITGERLFAVLPPDPQRLDHDGDGIGCEPVAE